MSEWIDVNKELPKKKGTYIVKAPGYCGRNYIEGDIAHSTFWPNYKKPWAIERGCSRYTWRQEGDHITHWAYLPGEENNNE